MVVLDSSTLLQQKSGASVVFNQGDFEERPAATKATHVHLEKKRITEIGELNACPRLRVLYLFDNEIKRIENLDFCSNLTHLYLQNNKIKKIENMHQLPNLQKLFLSQNYISVLEGLTGNPYLMELHLDHQRLASGESLLVDPRTISHLKLFPDSWCEFIRGCIYDASDALHLRLQKNNSLQVLDVSANALTDLKDFAQLSGLVSLTASGNKVSSVEELLESLEELEELEELSLTGNSVSKAIRYREKVMMVCQKLTQLDRKAVKDQNRQFLLRMKDSRSFMNFGRTSDEYGNDTDPSPARSRGNSGAATGDYPDMMVGGRGSGTTTVRPKPSGDAGSFYLGELKPRRSSLRAASVALETQPPKPVQNPPEWGAQYRDPGMGHHNFGAIPGNF